MNGKIEYKIGCIRNDPDACDKLLCRCALIFSCFYSHSYSHLLIITCFVIIIYNSIPFGVVIGIATRQAAYFHSRTITKPMIFFSLSLSSFQSDHSRLFSGRLDSYINVAHCFIAINIQFYSRLFNFIYHFYHFLYQCSHYII